MPIFNLINFNVNNFQPNIQTPTPSTYSKITLKGEGKFGLLYGQTKAYTQAEIDAIDTTSAPDEEEWGVDTFILARHDGDLQGGNETSLPAPITQWDILRKSNNDAKFTNIASVDDLETVYVDKLARSNETYIYQWIPLAGDVLGSPLQSEETTTDFQQVVLLEESTGDLYSFCLDLRLSEIRTNEDFAVENTRGKYPTSQRGNTNYSSGSIGVIVRSNAVTEDELEQDIQYVRDFQDFLTNGVEKVLKYTSGLTYRVQTSNVALTTKTGRTSSGSEIYLVSFEWTEISDL